MGRAPAGVRRAEARGAAGSDGDHRPPPAPSRQVGAAGRGPDHRRGPQDERRQVRQEGVARAVQGLEGEGRLMRRTGALIAGGLLFLQSGGGTGLGHAVDQITGASTAPVPTVAPRPVVRPDSVWVPDRYVPAPTTGSPVLVPGHWERRGARPASPLPPPVTHHPPPGRAPTGPARVGAPPPPPPAPGPASSPRPRA